MDWPRLYRLGAAHRGVVGLRCARTAGIPAPVFLRACQRQRLPELRPRTFLLPGWPDDGGARTFAAALASGEGAVVTGWAALAQLGLTRAWPTTPELLLPATARTSPLPGVRTRWSSVVPADAVVEVAGVRFTDAARTIAQLAGRTHLGRLRAIGFDAMHQGLLEVDHLQREIEARRRFPGRGAVRQLVRDLIGDGSESGFEFDARDRLTDLGLEPDRDQPVVTTHAGRRRRIDIAYTDHLVGIECLSFAHHADAAELESDAIRSNELAELDRWLILRLTFKMFHQDWPPFIAQLRRCLAARARA